MKITNTKKPEQDFGIRNDIKTEIRVRKNQKNFLIKLVLSISLVNTILLGLLLATSWEGVVQWLQKIL